MPLGFPPAALASGLALTPAAGDIFVVSYPKSGTTWLQYIVYLLLGGRALGADQRLAQVFPHLEEVGAEAVERLPAPRLIKTHLPFARTPFSRLARYLYIARNPFDCVVSFYHHTRGFPQHYDFAAGSFAEFFDCFMAGEVDFGDYFEHLKAWQAAADRNNVLLLTYESLRVDPAAAIGRVAGFLGGEAAAAGADRASVARVIAESGIDAMRRDQQRWSSARPAWATPFVHQGLVGGWPALMTPAMTRTLLAEFDRRLGATPSAQLWPDVIAEARIHSLLKEQPSHGH